MCFFALKQTLIQHPHHGHYATYNGTHGSEEGNVPLLVHFGYFHMQRRDLVKEIDAGYTATGTGVDVSEVFRNTVLIRLNGGAIEIPV